MSHRLRGSRIAYQFSKSKRFETPRPECPVAFYLGPAGKDNDSRSTSFGIGNRSDFTRGLSDRDTPPPTKYQPEGDDKRGAKPGYTFGLSRDKVIDKSYIDIRPGVPGIGKYEVPLNQSSISFSMRKRLNDYERSQQTYLKNPGPGRYQFKSDFFLQGRAISGARSARFPTEKATPGPGAYNTFRGEIKGGKCMSNDCTAASENLFREGRLSLVDKKSCVPGPGAYTVPLQFGDEPFIPRKRFSSTFR